MRRWDQFKWWELAILSAGALIGLAGVILQFAILLSILRLLWTLAT